MHLNLLLLSLSSLSSALTIPLNRLPRSNALRNTSSTNTSPLLATQFGTVFDVSLTVGSNQQPFSLLIDTGSSDTYLMRSNFTCINSTTNLAIPSFACNYGAQTYTPSDTYAQVPNQTFGVKYGNGLASGIMAYENITLAGISVRTKLGIADTSNPMGDGVNSGVLGLGYPSLTSAHPGRHTPNDSYWFHRAEYNPVFQSMYKQGLVEPWFSIALAHTPRGKNASAHAFGGYLTLGELPPVKHSDDFSVVPVEIMHNIPKNFTSGRTQRSYWGLTVSGAQYGADADSLTTSNKTYQAFVDTGNEFSYLPSAVVDAVNARFSPPAKYSEDLGLSVVDCDAEAPEFGLVIGNQTFYHAAEDLIYDTGKGYCVSGLISSESVAMGDMVLNILGVPFLKNVVAVFDFGKDQMRFSQTA